MANEQQNSDGVKVAERLREPDANNVDPAAYRGVGYLMQQERLRHGWDLRVVAEQLRIRFKYLQAIESGQFDQLPGRIYATGFLKTYAELLKLDQSSVLEAFAQERKPTPVGNRLVFPAPAPETHTPKGWLVLLALVIGGLVYGVWYYTQNRDRIVSQLVPPVPERMQQEAPPLADPAARATPPASSSSAPPTLAGSVPSTPPASSPAPAVAPVSPPVNPRAIEVAPLGSASSITPSPTPPASSPSAPPPAVLTLPAPPASAPSAPPASSAPPAAQPAAPPVESQVAAIEPPPPSSTLPQGQVFGNPAARSRVSLRAHADSWIDVRGSNNEPILPSRVLRTGDTFVAPDRSDLVLWTGNLGALEISVDGKPLPRLGALGEARRNISLDPARLLAGTAVSR